MNVSIRLALVLLLCLPCAARQGTPVTARFTALGSATSGVRGPLHLRLDGPPVVGRTLAVRVTNARPNAAGAVYVGTAGVTTPLPPFQATLHLSSPRVLAPFVADERGDSGRRVEFVVPAAFAGLEVGLQAIALDGTAPGGLAFTRGIRLRFGSRPDRPTFARPLTPLADDATDHVLGDWDGDGDLDVAVTHAGTAVQVLGNAGAARFVPLQWTSTPHPSTALASGDLDGDGTDDLVAAHTSAGALSILLGLGDGTLGTPQPFTTGTGPSQLELADADGDGDLDVFTVEPATGELALHPGQGDGTLSPRQVVASGPTPRDLVTADFDLDGVLDVAAIYESEDRVRTFRGQPGGGFVQDQEVLLGVTGERIAVGDVDGDQVPDLVTIRDGWSAAGDGVAVLRGVGDGTFDVSYHDDNHLDRVDLRDLDLDGADEIVVWTVSRSPSVFSWTAGGALELRYAEVSNWDFPSISLDDVDGDEVPDFVVLSDHNGFQVPRGLAVFHGLADATFEGGLQGIAGEDSAEVTDLDLDGVPDVFSMYLAFTDDAIAALGTIESTLEIDFDEELELFGLLAQDSAVGDFDGDGFPDFVVAGSTAMFNGFGKLRTYRGLGDGSFALLADTFLPDPGGSSQGYPWRVARTDLDGDPHADLILLDGSYLKFLTGTGTGLFTQGSHVHTGIFPTSVPDTRFQLADLDGDGTEDVTLVDGSFGSTSVRVFPRAPGPSFLPPVDSDVGIQPFELGFGDFDEDGDLDLVVGGRFELHVRAGDGGGGFGAPLFVHAPAYTSSSTSDHHTFAIADFDADGHLDLVLATPFDRALFLLRGRGDGTFDPQETYYDNSTSSNGSRALLALDLNGDGVPELATGRTLVRNRTLY